VTGFQCADQVGELFTAIGAELGEEFVGFKHLETHFVYI
jgi:hypothetical protein